jgi:hypothetical protein
MMRAVTAAATSLHNPISHQAHKSIRSANHATHRVTAADQGGGVNPLPSPPTAHGRNGELLWACKNAAIGHRRGDTELLGRRNGRRTEQVGRIIRSMSPPIAIVGPNPASLTASMGLPATFNVTAVAHWLGFDLHELCPNDGSKIADWLTGGGTVALAALAFVAALFSGYQFTQGQKARHAEKFSEVATRWSETSFLEARMIIWSLAEKSKETTSVPHEGTLDPPTGTSLADKEITGVSQDVTHDAPKGTIEMTIEALKGTPEAAKGPTHLMTTMFQLRAASNFVFWRLQTVLDYFENLAELVNYGAISINMVDRTLGNLVCLYWGYWQPYVCAERARDPELYTEFEKLAKRISKKHKNQKPWTFTGCPPRPKATAMVV